MSCLPSARSAPSVPSPAASAGPSSATAAAASSCFSTGDGGAATNDVNVLLRQATVHKLPVLIVVWNNHWAITTEAQAQWAGDLTAQVRAMGAVAVDANGVDPIEMFETTRQLAERLRNGEGPAFIHAHMGLLDPHSSSTDIRRYRTREEIEETTRTKDPVKYLGEQLVARGELRPDDLERIRDEAKELYDPPRNRWSASLRSPPSASPSTSSRFPAGAPSRTPAQPAESR